MYRPRQAAALPRQIPDDMFDELFAGAAFASGPGAGRFLGLHGRAGCGTAGGQRWDADPARQVISVVRKGTRAMQQLPACPDAFVWLALYQHGCSGQVTVRRR